jgi:hypothetical protein
MPLRDDQEDQKEHNSNKIKGVDCAISVHTHRGENVEEVQP